MTKTLEAAGYMAQDRQGNAIYGVGATASEALEDAYANAGPQEDHEGNVRAKDDVIDNDFKVYGATQNLIDRVNTKGGAIAWEIVRGVACTPEEAE